MTLRLKIFDNPIELVKFVNTGIAKTDIQLIYQDHHSNRFYLMYWA